MRATATHIDQYAQSVLFALVTVSRPRSRQSVTSGKTPRFAWASPFGLHPASELAGLSAGAGRRAVPLSYPFDIGLLASISIKGTAAPTSSPVRYSLRSVPHAASIRALDTDSDHDVIPFGDVKAMAKSAACHQCFVFLPSPMATTHCNLVASIVTKWH